MTNSYDLELGQFVFAVGNPLGFEYYGTVTMGIISGTTRYVDDGDFSATLIQHDAAISPGNSGGALLNLNGELIGINNMKIVDDLVTGIGFAIPANTVRRIVTDLEDDGIVTRPYLGISTNALTNNCGLQFGVCIRVLDGGAALAAGLIDDDVIIGYMNADMTEFLVINNFNDLKEAILNSSVGENITIRYIRDSEVFVSDEVILGTHPDD
jgi:serine protease Do